MNIIKDDEHADYGEVEIPNTPDVLEEDIIPK